ncbi:heterokaryon incompatibility protein [Cordyceps javanica]|uniref:Heterokaryon incompatibility protein n=1 Tax=Cordyceps javanica TaxID=43265 RepID=A0A545VLX3_9HYPO|nr:heterokaryon incompatibility protein [Cordyceps javanica]TQW02714.1 heterokaryon incompatibility protein [Cordyceps javanica]
MTLDEEARPIRYRSLSGNGGELRLLELQPALTNNINEPIVCRLVHETVKESSQFIALSSLYGDVSVKEHIMLDGVRVVIPQHLSEALRYIRAVFLTNTTPNSYSSVSSSSGSRDRSEQAQSVLKKRPPRWLLPLLRGFRNIFVEPSSRSSAAPSLCVWLDLLCVNKRDAREASEKRLHMTRAYQNATLVVGWLGTKDSTSDLAIEIIRAWDKCMPASFGEPGDREAHPENYAPIMQWMAPVQHLSEIPEGITDARQVPSYNAIFQFLNRPFFRNAWLLEEMSLARFPAFLVGDDIISWMQILRLNRANEEIRDHGAEMFPDELRPLLQYMPLGSVFAFLEAFDARQREKRAEVVQ